MLKYIVFQNGENWKRHRKVLDPAFFRLDKYFDVFISKTLKTIEVFKENNGLVKDITQKLTLDILGLTVFGNDFDSLSGNFNNDIDSYKFVFGNIFDFKKIIQNEFLSSFKLLNIIKKWRNKRNILII